MNSEGLEQTRTLERSTHTSPDRRHNPQHDVCRFHHICTLNGPTGLRTGWRPNASTTRYLCANLLDCSQQAAEFNSNWLRGSTTPKQSKQLMHRHLTTRINFSRLGAHFLRVLRHFDVDDVIAAPLRSRGKTRQLILCVTTSLSVSGCSAEISPGQIEQH